MLLSRLNEAELLKSSELRKMGPVARVLDPAMIPEDPVWPNKKKILILALAMGVFIGCGTAFLLEYFDRSFRSVDDVMDYLSIPVLATIPKLPTYDAELKTRMHKRVAIACIALGCLLAMIVVADVVSAELTVRDSILVSIARKGADSLTGIYRSLKGT